MKSLVTIVSILLFTTFSCSKKNNSCNCSATNQVCATIVQVAGNCNNFGIKVNGQEYPSQNIPSQFQNVGLNVCVEYILFQDLRLCACCGGTWADIKSMTKTN